MFVCLEERRMSVCLVIQHQDIVSLLTGIYLFTVTMQLIPSKTKKITDKKLLRIQTIFLLRNQKPLSRLCQHCLSPGQNPRKKGTDDSCTPATQQILVAPATQQTVELLPYCCTRKNISFRMCTCNTDLKQMINPALALIKLAEATTQNYAVLVINEKYRVGHF